MRFRASFNEHRGEQDDMLPYSAAFRSRMVARLVGPNAITATALGKETGLHQATLSRWPNSFSHIFAGGYAAGYYSYKWAEVLSADAYAAFEEAAQTRGTVLDPETGMRYRQAILEAGGSRPAMESFKAFRGRQPTIDALLRHGGMAA